MEQQKITVYNVNAIHELYSENELAAKKIYHNKNALVFGRVDKVDNEHVIIEGDSEFGRLFCNTAVKIWTKSLLFEKTAEKSVEPLKLTGFLGACFFKMNNCRDI